MRRVPSFVLWSFVSVSIALAACSSGSSNSSTDAGAGAGGVAGGVGTGGTTTSGGTTSGGTGGTGVTGGTGGTTSGGMGGNATGGTATGGTGGTGGTVTGGTGGTVTGGTGGTVTGGTGGTTGGTGGSVTGGTGGTTGGTGGTTGGTGGSVTGGTGGATGGTGGTTGGTGGTTGGTGGTTGGTGGTTGGTGGTTGGTGGTGDVTPPHFLGCTSIDNVGVSTMTVHWAAGSDDTTPVAGLVYDIYYANTAGAEVFTTPNATSAPGATSITLSGLFASKAYYVVCRARDAAGNEDTNTAERSATTTCDTSVPTFAGAVMTKVVPPSTTSIRITWAAATDPNSPPSDMIYHVYQSSTASGEDFTTPTATTAKGATFFDATGLTANTTYYWVVRAEDPCGNREANNVEVSGTTCSTTAATGYACSVQAIFNRSCTFSTCHGGTNPAGLGLLPAVSYSNLVNVLSTEVTTLDRVKPNDSANSYLYQKITGTAAKGNPMPPRGGPLAQADIDLIKAWIDNNAPNN